MVPARDPAFRSFAEVNPNDRAVAVFLERLKTLENAVPEGWRGVWAFHTK